MTGKIRRQESAAVETQITTEPDPTKTRFDLEQDILACWSVINDIQNWARSDRPNWQALSDYYDQKFQILWDTFELMIKEGKLK